MGFVSADGVVYKPKGLQAIYEETQAKAVVLVSCLKSYYAIVYHYFNVCSVCYVR